MCTIFECVSHVKCDVSAISCINFAETSSNVCVSERKISIKKKVKKTQRIAASSTEY